MPKGGYVIIDFESKVLTGSNMRIPGIYSKIESINQKPVLFKNIVVGNTEIQYGVYGLITKQSSSYFIVYGINASGHINGIWVEPNDNVRSVTITGNQGDLPVSEEDGPSASM